jgi:prevent-host-death family protein
MLASRTTSITELRDQLATVVDSLDESGPVMIVRHSKPAAYLISPAIFEALLELVEDAEDRRDMQMAVRDYRQGQAVPAKEVFKRLGV